MKKTMILTVLSILLSLPFSMLSAQTDIPETKIRAEAINGPANNSHIVRVIYNFPDGYHQSFQKDYFYFTIAAPENVLIGEISYPAATDANFYGETILEAELTGFQADDEELLLKVNWQLCSEDGLCLFPESDIISAELNISPLSPLNTNDSVSPYRLLLYLLTAFIGGLLLNIMPCVLPVLSIKALSLVKQGGDSRRQILSASLLYAAGVIISLLVLATAVIALKASGEQVGWGFQFQNRGFVIVLLTIIFLFALSLFDVFPISAPVIRPSKKPLNKKGSAGSHFFSGVLAVLLATPCTAPFLGSAAGFAFSQPPAIIAAVFFMIGLGLSFPFILIGFFPSAVSRLPKPGPWMNTFRVIMGFLLVGTAIWLIDVLLHQSDGGYLTRVLIYLAAVSFAAWLYGLFSTPGTSAIKRWSGLTAAVIIILLSGLLLLRTGNDVVRQASPTEAESGYSDWLAFSPATAESFIGGDKPVFIAFSAKWCMTCRANETTVIFTEPVESFFKETGTVLIHGDFTNKNPELNNWMTAHGRAGVPFYAWYAAGSKDAVILPEVITKQMITGLETISAGY